MTAIPIIISREYGLADPNQPCRTLPQVSYLARDGTGWHPIPTCSEDARMRAGNARCRALTGASPPFDPNEVDVAATRRLGCQTGRLLSPQDGIWPYMALKAEGGIDNILGFPPVYTNAFSEYMYVWGFGTGKWDGRIHRNAVDCLLRHHPFPLHPSQPNPHTNTTSSKNKTHTGTGASRSTTST